MSAVFSGATISFKGHTGNYIDVQGNDVQARWADRGLWQSLVIESLGGRALFSGDYVFLKAHTGKMLDVEGVSVQARWLDYGSWQRFAIEKEAGGAIMPGDSIFLRAHTGTVVEVHERAVGANWDDHGSWQVLVIEKLETRRLSQARGSSLIVIHGYARLACAAFVMIILLASLAIKCLQQRFREALSCSPACKILPVDDGDREFAN